MNTFYKYTVLLLMVLFGIQMINAQETVSKKIIKKHPISSNGELNIDTKYGDVVINGWEKDSISISVSIKVSHKKIDNAKDLLDRIQPKIVVVGDLATVSSVITAKKDNIFSNYFNKSNPLDYDKTNVQINYTINLPSKAALDISNKFGDVIIDNNVGRLIANVQHGDMWINQNITNGTINIKYGKLKTKAVSYGNITLKNAELELLESQNLILNSSGSTITIAEVIGLEIISNKDKIIASSIGEISGELSFSEMKLNTLSDELNLTMKVTDLQVSKVNKPEAYVHIVQESSDININITGLAFKFKANLEQGVLRIPKSFKNIKTFMIDDDKKLREINATYGVNPLGKFSISGKKGDIVLIDNTFE